MNWSVVLGWVITDEHRNDFVGLVFENKKRFFEMCHWCVTVRHSSDAPVTHRDTLMINLLDIAFRVAPSIGMELV